MATVVLAVDGGAVNVLAAELELVRRGAWMAHLETSGDATFAEGLPATLTLAGEIDGSARTFVGTVRRSLPWQGRTRTVVVGGAGKLRQALPPVDHVGAPSAGVTAALIAQGIASASGETLAPSVASDLEGLSLPRWTRAGADALGFGGSAIEGLDALVYALAELAADPRWTWRTLADGTIWIGVDAWPAYAGDIGNAWIDDADDGRIDCAPPVADLLPGAAVLGHRIERVTYRVNGSTARAELLYPVAGDVAGRKVADVYQQSHGATTVTQQADGSLDLLCDDPRIGGMRFVPFRCGAPGRWLTIPDGSRVRVAFENGSPDGAYCYALDQDSNATKPIALKDDSVKIGYLAGTTSAGPVTFTLLPTPGDPTAIHLTGTIDGPCDKYNMGVPNV